MTKATLTLADGSKVTIEGNPEEVALLLGKLTSSPTAPNEPATHLRANKTGKQAATRRSIPATGRGPTRYVLELRDEGFFSAKRTLDELRTKLEEGGHIYPRTSISPVLTRLVRQRQIRRIKEDRNWKYVDV
jgi:hypothetical protein